MEFNQVNNNAGDVYNLQAGPLTSAEAIDTVLRTTESMGRYGWWNKICVHCGASCGGRLAEYGRPDPDDLKCTCCPNCAVSVEGYDGKNHIRVEFVPGEG